MKKIILISLVVILGLVGLYFYKNPVFIPKDSDVVSIFGEDKDVDRFNAFVENVKNKKKDKIRTIEKTDEGDPLVWNLKYDGEIISVRWDTRYDKFGPKEIYYNKCKSIKVEKEEFENGNRIKYLLDECEDKKLYNQIFYVVQKNESNETK